MNPLNDFMAFIYLDSFLFVAGFLMLAIGGGYAIVEWVMERLTRATEN